MKIIKVSSFVIIILSLIAVSGEMLKKKKHDDLVREKKRVELLIEGSKLIKKIWEEGSYRNTKLSCPDFLGDMNNTDSTYLQCNPSFIECLFASVDNHVVLKKRNIKHKIYLKKEFKDSIGNKRVTQVVSGQIKRVKSFSGNGVIVGIYLKEKGFSTKPLYILLKDRCNDIFLPRRIYGYGKESNKWYWDNFNQNIYIDKFLVSNRDIAEWISYSNNSKLRSKYKKIFENKKILSNAATSISHSDMENYCHFKGKYLLEAHVYDAATSFPGDYQNTMPEYVTRYPYPWMTGRKRSFLYKMNKNDDYMPSESDCKKAYVKECFNILPYEQHDTASYSWVGIFQILGGPMEMLNNRIDSHLNLKVSSYYLSGRDSKQVLSKRFFWDWSLESDTNVKSIDQNLNVKDPDIGFRCMSFKM